MILATRNVVREIVASTPGSASPNAMESREDSRVDTFLIRNIIIDKDC